MQGKIPYAKLLKKDNTVQIFEELLAHNVQVARKTGWKAMIQLFKQHEFVKTGDDVSSKKYFLPVLPYGAYKLKQMS